MASAVIMVEVEVADEAEERTAHDLAVGVLQGYFEVVGTWHGAAQLGVAEWSQ